MLLLQNKFSYMKTGLENVLKNRKSVRLGSARSDTIKLMQWPGII